MEPVRGRLTAGRDPAGDAAGSGRAFATASRARF
jgi:hypothetical protein